jgi:hypothetical protein
LTVPGWQAAANSFLDFVHLDTRLVLRWKLLQRDQMLPWRAWRSRLKVMGLASQPNPTPHQRFTPRSPTSQAPSGE